MMKGLLVLSVVGTLVVPQLTLASESRFDDDGKRQASISGGLPLPPIPSLDTTPWINLGLEKGPRIDTLLLPVLHLPPVSKSSAVADNKREAPSRIKAE